ncbi:MAG: ATP-binding protein [Oscillospiraceae bacterium]|nr:ATP-binding protein [Oscillospiraceae bacterium]
MLERKDYIDQIVPYFDMPFVKILTGVRRCGKSTIMLMLMDALKKRGIAEEHIVRFNFDTLEWQNASATQVFEIIKAKLAPGGRTYLFLDEIQEIENWEILVNTFMEEPEYDVDIFVTGSNSKMMSSEISTYLTGRYVSFRIHPLSFSEYLAFKKAYGEVGDVNKEFLNYIEYGGFPAVHLKPLTLDEAYVIVKDIYNTTILVDIVKRNQIRKVDQLERIVKFAFDNVGNVFSANSIRRFFESQGRKIDVETVYNYLSKLENAYILNRCLRQDLQGRELLKTQEKFYLADISLKHAVLGYRKDDISQILENLVYLELRRRGYDVHVGKLDTQEIDFAAEKQGKILYVQVAYLLADRKTQEREFGNLLKIQDNFPKFVVSMDEVDMSQKGIVHMNIRDFLLNDWKG